MNDHSARAKTGFGVLLLVFLLPTLTLAQSRSRREEPPTAKQLEMRTEKAEEALVDEYKEIANEFYQQGEKERALELLDRLRKLNPRMPGLRERIESIQEEMLQANETELEIDTSKGWGTAIALVEQGKPFRIAAAGDYRIRYDVTLGVQGLPAGSGATGLIEGIPWGALIGVVATDGEIGKPFAVQSGLEYTPEKSGQLYLRVNLPAEARCTGKVKVRLSGGVTTENSPRVR